MSKFNDIDLAFDALRVTRVKNRRLEPLSKMDDVACLAEYLRTEREGLIGRIRSESALDRRIDSPGGIAMSREFSDLIDAVIGRMFGLACEAIGANPGSIPIAIVATGGYGRQELAPFSDIDLTFIPQRDGDPATDRIVRGLFKMVMDVFIARCGLEVGYAYRLLSDCDNLDHQTTCGLLDARLIAGNERLFIQFEDAFWLGFNPTDFIFTKIQEREAMLHKWGLYTRVVEPQLKEGPGGLRDFHTSIWLIQARNQLAAARVRGDRAFRVLESESHLSPSELATLMEAKERLFLTRNALHAVSGAGRDQLVVTRQEEIAALFGYGPGSSEETPGVEQFMAELYPLLATVRRVAGQIMRRVANSRLMLGIGLDCKRKEIVAANEALHSDDPAWLIWACELAQKYGLEISEGIEDAALALVEQSPITRQTAQTNWVFTQILSRSGKVYPILQKMADLKILNWFMPEFAGLMDLIPYDASHDFTVGQHSLLVLRHVESLLIPDGLEEQAEMRRALEELPHPEYLMLAALLHDSGKVQHGRPHSEVSAVVAEAVCRRLGWTDEAIGQVCFLVRNHQLMGETSRLRDLNLDGTIRDFTRQVDDPERLNMLYLLTYADTRAVGDGIWTAVKGRFLRELWQRAMAFLYEAEPPGDAADSVAQARRRLVKDLTLENLPESDVAEHIQSMPPYYLLNRSLREVALHIGFVRRVRAGEIVLDYHDERSASFTELTVCIFDDPAPGLLAKIAGALYAASLNVHSAQVVTRVSAQDRIALDTLLIDYRGRPLSAGKRKEVTTILKDVLSGAKGLDEVIRSKKQSGRPLKGGGRAGSAPSLRVDSVRNDLAEGLTVIEVCGPDALGVFYHLCRILSDQSWSIQSAKLATMRAEVRASFYIEGADALSESEVKRGLSQAISASQPW